MKTITFVSALLFTITALAQTSLQKIPVEPFNQLEIGGRITVYINPTGEESVSISPEDFKNLSYSVKEGVLKLNGGSGKVYLHTKTLNQLSVTDAAEAYSSDTLKGDALRVNSSGSGKSNLLLKFNTVDVRMSGAADVKLAGNAASLNGTVSGPGDLQAYSLQVNEAKITIEGAGDAQINVAISLKSTISGDGTVFYQGSVTQVESNLTGKGEIKRANPLADNDTTRIRLGKREIIIFDEKGRTEIEIGDEVKIGEEEKEAKQNKNRRQYIWSGFEVGVNGWLNVDNTLNMDSINTPFALNYGKSICTNINFWETRGHIIKDNFFITTGLGTEFNNYRFEHDTRLIKDAPGNPAMLDTVAYSKTKLTLGFLNAPLYLTLATNPLKNGKRLSISPGITAGWRFLTYNKLVSEDSEGKRKTRNRDDFNIQPFRLNASLRIAYGSFLVFANYSLDSLFKKNQGPYLTPFSAGIRIIGLGKS